MPSVRFEIASARSSSSSSTRVVELGALEARVSTLLTW